MSVRKIIKKFLFNNGYELFRGYYYDFDGNDSIKKVLKLAGINFDNLVIFDIGAEVIFSDAYNKSASLKGIESILEKHGFILWDIPYIGKFADTAINRINFIDALFVNTNLLSKLSSSSTSNNK